MQRLFPEIPRARSHDLAPALNPHWLDKTDRPLQMLQRRIEGSHHSISAGDDDARAHWLEENGVETHFIDAGIGCCWVAEKGDLEPVTGESEDAALLRLAEANGLVLWSDK